jgi:Tfp pilus assembly protein PilF
MTLVSRRCGAWSSVLVVTGTIALSCGCGTRSFSPYGTPAAGDRNALKAQELTQQAARDMDADPAQAEEVLRAALAADLYYGPAHNNLGVLHLKQNKLYEAATEFEWARKLMPGHPDPRMNLALTLEKAGRIDEAMATYKTALEVYCGHMPTMQAMARLQVRHNRADDQTMRMLNEIALAGETDAWRAWAQGQLLRLDARGPASQLD